MNTCPFLPLTQIGNLKLLDRHHQTTYQLKFQIYLKITILLRS